MRRDEPRHGSVDAVRLRAPGGGVVPLRYVEDGPELFVVPSSVAPGWSSATLRAGGARLLRPGEDVGSAGELRAADLVSDPARSEWVRREFRRKYGAAVWDRYFARHPKILVLRPAPRLSPPGRLALIRQEFDAVAPFYPASVASNPFERYLKSRALEHLKELLAGQDPLLEIGPGPGFETVPMVRAGHRVTAVDLSPGMRQALAERLAAEGLADRVTLRAGGLATIGSDLPDLAAGSFGGAWSTFGAPNLEPDAPAVARGLARLLRPGAPLLLGLLQRWAIAPLVFEAVRADWGAIRARQQRPVPAEKIRYPLDIHLWTPREYARACAPYFVFRRAIPLSALAPPFASPRLLRAFGPRTWAFARRLDRWITPRLPALSEWILLELRRSPVPAPGASPPTPAAPPARGPTETLYRPSGFGGA